MTTIHQIRESIDAKLDKWEAQAAALQAELELTKSDVFDRIEEQKRRLEQVAQQVRDKVDAAGGLADEAKTKIKASFEHLQVQLVLGAADTRDNYQDWKQKIHSSIAEFEADFEVAMAEDDAALQEDLDALAEAYVREADALEVEIDAMQAQFSEDKAKAKADFEKYKQDVQFKIDAYKVELGEKRKVAADKLGEFEAELSAGANKIKDAFSHLFS